MIRILPLFEPDTDRDTLHDLVEADPALDKISVVEASETGAPRVFTSTSTEERAEVLDLAGRVLATKASASRASWADKVWPRSLDASAALCSHESSDYPPSYLVQQ